MRVFLHTRESKDDYDWTNTEENFEYIPRVGDCIGLRSETIWYEVDLVVWFPKSSEAEYPVEIYAVEVDGVQAQIRAHQEAVAKIRERGVSPQEYIDLTDAARETGQWMRELADPKGEAAKRAKAAALEKLPPKVPPKKS